MDVVISMNTKKELLGEWKKKCAIQALISYQSSVYYNFMDMFFGIPSAVLTSVVVILKGYSSIYGSEYQMAELIILILSTLFDTIHMFGNFSSLADKFKWTYDKYSSIKRDIDIFETMHLTEEETIKKIFETKKLIEAARQESRSAPWFVYRRFDETDELMEAIRISDELE